MKFDTVEELLAFQALLDQCRGQVWIEAPDGRRYDLTDRAARMKGLLMLAGDAAEEFGLYARMREDEMLLLNYYCDRMEKTA